MESALARAELKLQKESYTAGKTFCLCARMGCFGLIDLTNGT